MVLGGGVKEVSVHAKLQPSFICAMFYEDQQVAVIIVQSLVLNLDTII